MKFMREKMIVFIGVLLVLLPMTGFPRSWKSFFTIILGLVLVYLGVLYWKSARASQKNMSSEKRTGTFTEIV